MYTASASPKLPSIVPTPAVVNVAWTNLARRQELSPHLLHAVRGWYEVRTRSRFDGARFLADHGPHLIFSSRLEAESSPRPGRLEANVQCFHLPDGVYIALTREPLFGTRLTLWAPTPALAKSAFETLRTKYALAPKRQTAFPVFYVLKSVGDEVGVQPISLPAQYQHLWRRRRLDDANRHERPRHLLPGGFVRHAAHRVSRVVQHPPPRRFSTLIIPCFHRSPASATIARN